MKLTSIYLGVIMAISLFFSASIYNLASHEIGRGYRSQSSVIGNGDFNLPPPLQQRLDDSRRQLVDEARSHLLSSLFFTNLAILVLGGALSYILARKTLEPIENAHQSLEQFTADASHELRTPLAAMKAEIEVALMQKSLPTAEAKQVLESNLEEVESLTKLSDNLLNLARLEEPKLEVVVCSVSPVIKNVVKKLATSAEKKHISIETKIEPATLKLLADKNALEQIVVALLDNAVKYSPEKSNVTITATLQRNAVSIAVSDSGVGIKKAEQAKIFDRFYQADTARSKQENPGHGLGLAIVKLLVEKQAGTVSVASMPGKGSTFTIFLPKA